MRTLVIIAVATLASACSTTRKEQMREYFNLVHPTYVTDVRIDGHAITLPQGRALVVRLPEEPSTGQRWEMVPFRSYSVIAPVQHDYVGPDESMASPEAPGSALFRLRGIAPGTQSVVLEYRRPLESAAAKTVRFDVVVR